MIEAIKTVLMVIGSVHVVGFLIFVAIIWASNRGQVRR